MYAEFTISDSLLAALGTQMPQILSAGLTSGETLRIYDVAPPTSVSLEYGNPGQSPCNKAYTVGCVEVYGFYGPECRYMTIPETSGCDLTGFYHDAGYVLLHWVNRRQLVEPTSFSQNWELYPVGGNIQFWERTYNSQLYGIQIGQLWLKGWKPKFHTVAFQKFVEVSVIGALTKEHDRYWLIRRIEPDMVYATIATENPMAFNTGDDVHTFIKWLQEGQKWQQHRIFAYLKDIQTVKRFVRKEGYGVIVD